MLGGRYRWDFWSKEEKTDTGKEREFFSQVLEQGARSNYVRSQSQLEPATSAVGRWPRRSAEASR